MKPALGMEPPDGAGEGVTETQGEPYWKRKLGSRVVLLQVWIAAVVNLGSVAAGASLGFTAVALQRMQNENSTRQLTDGDKSWIASVTAGATPIGCLFSGWLMDTFGRRSAILAQNVPALLGWLLLAAPPLLGGTGAADSMAQILTGRALTGMATGMGSVPATVYVAEVSSKPLRSMFVTWTSIAMALGILFVYVLGAEMEDWRTMAAICASFPLVAGALTLFVIPESPVWLLARKRDDDAFKSLQRLRAGGPEAFVQAEFSTMRADDEKSRRRQVGRKRSWGDLLRDLRRPECWKPLLILNGFFFFQQTSGVFVIIFYAVDVVQNSGIETDPFMVTILIGTARLGVTVLAGVMSTKVGRRPLSISSGVGMTLCVFLLAGHLALDGSESWKPGSWLPVSALIGFILFSTLGFLTLPWAMVGEVFPQRIRGAAGGFTTCAAYLYNFAVLKSYPFMEEALGAKGVFFIYGAMSLIGTIFVALFLPETRGRSLREIEESFAGKTVGSLPSDEDTAEMDRLADAEKCPNTIIEEKIS